MNSDIKMSVIMPTYNQCAFIRRAILSLMRQTFKDWELIIVNDGCTDGTELYLSDYLNDKRIVYIKNEENCGLGHALNQGIDAAHYDYIAYLPSDDYYFENHLASLAEKFSENSNCSLAYSGVKFFSNDTLQGNNVTESVGIKQGTCLQLVQTAHRKVAQRWVEREQYITDDLFQMYWMQLLGEGEFVRTGCVSCYWTAHPFQRHRIVGERNGGGLNRARAFYHIKQPIKMRISREKFTDEAALYQQFRSRTAPTATGGLKILLVGELAYNSERICALERAGNQLFGLWTPSPRYSFSTVGPLPFGHVRDIPFDDHWIEHVRQIEPDVIYGLLNSESVAFVHDVVRRLPEVPFVWHFKEGPSVCLSLGVWDKLIWLYQHAAGRIFLNKFCAEWYAQFLPPSNAPTLVMDGDLPSEVYFTNHFSPKLSDADGEVHTVVTGRLVGLMKEDIEMLVAQKIHVHSYTENYFDCNARHNGDFTRAFPKYFHSHKHVGADNWTRELSQYDAGWLHGYSSQNGGNLLHASWDDLNMPARMATYAAAGIPFVLPENKGHLVASREVATELNVGITYANYLELAAKLKQEITDRTFAANILKHRKLFCFDHYLPQLMEHFRRSISYHHANKLITQ